MHLHPRRLTAASFMISGVALAIAAGSTAAMAATPTPSPAPPAPTPSATPVVVAASWAPGGPLGGLGTGRIWSVVASPAAATTVVAGTDRGVYISIDSGAHWAASALSTSRVWVVGFDPRDPRRLFAGTDGDGIKLTQDGGATWTDASAGLTSRTVRTIAFGLDGFAAGTTNGVLLSPDGVTWHAGGLSGDSVASLVVAANSPALVLVAGIDRGPDLGAGYLFRYSGPGPAWQPLQSGLAASAVLSSLAAGPLTASVTKRPLLATTSKGTFRSGDGGNTWTLSTGIAENLSLTTAVFSPLDPNLVYAGADAGSSSGGELLRSSDGGASFGIANSGLPAKTRQVVALAVEQVTPPTVIAALDPSSGGIVYSETDSSAPAPPALVAESPGAAIPATLATPVPTPRPPLVVAPSATPAPATGVAAVLATGFHWPVPLVFEILLVLLIAYLLVRWRQRYYVEGPP